MGHGILPQSLAPSGRVLPASDLSRRRTDAQLGIKEIGVYRFDVDMVAPPQMAEAAEPLVRAYRGELTLGDELRLPRASRHDRLALSRAVHRVLLQDPVVSKDRELDAGRELKMRQALEAFEEVASEIHHQSNMNFKD